ncbi:MAG: glycosyltransferase family 2 protein, partial [Kiloniellales bacterium]
GSLAAGADIIVNTDADNQYSAEDIPKLIAPILAGDAPIVIGARDINGIAHFPLMKKVFQQLGSWVVRIVSGTDISDAPSGFRAMSRDAAIQLNVFDGYTYTLEMIIQAGRRGIPITSVPVRTNPDLRPSRLIKSTGSYVRRSFFTIWRIFLVYKPFRFFVILGSIPFTLGSLLGVRWLVLFFEGTTRAHVPSLILAAILLLVGFMLWMLGLAADLQSVNRRLLEDIQLTLRRAKYAASVKG